MHFYKYHGLGNDYLVLDPARLPAPLNGQMTAAWAAAICHRTTGVGADGIVYGPLPLDNGSADQFACQIWNPDGSMAEVSGNGLRIFARYLREAGYVTPSTETAHYTLFSSGRTIPITYGAAADDPIAVSLGSASISPLVDDLKLPNLAELGDGWIVNVGNPHCVFFPAVGVPLDESLARRWGPLIETAVRFPNRTNVQFARSIDRSHLTIEIWERGAGYTLASGSSSCAAALAAVVSHRVDSPVTVQMPGGTLTIDVARMDGAWHVTLTGPVTPVNSGIFAPIWLRSLPLAG